MPLSPLPTCPERDSDLPTVTQLIRVQTRVLRSPGLLSPYSLTLGGKWQILSLRATAQRPEGAGEGVRTNRYGQAEIFEREGRREGWLAGRTEGRHGRAAVLSSRHRERQEALRKETRQTQTTMGGLAKTAKASLASLKSALCPLAQIPGQQKVP